MRIHHRVSIADANAHLVRVESRVENAPTGPLVVFMPVWTPGSYLVREYARHVEAFSAPGGATKIRKNAWSIAHDKPEITFSYNVYCNDLTVRTNHVDATHLYLNGAPTFMAIEGALDTEATVTLDLPAGWRVATALERDGLTLHAPSYDVLVDSPIEAGMFRDATFDAAGKKHTFAVWPADSLRDGNAARLVEATKAIVETEARLFGGSLPHNGYTFLLHLSSRGRGGLEHMASSTLLASPTSFDTRDGTLDLLSLIAHEYFHLWNVKRIRPAGLFPYQYEAENHTRQLWWFEGATSYYDWRVLRLAKLCSVDEYLDHLATEIAYLDTTPGRLLHSLEEASYDAWVKLYRPDENSQNSSISYYRKGELVCALLDIEIRARSKGAGSFDAVVLHLWKEYGEKGVPVPEGALQSIMEKVTSVSISDVFDAWVRSARDIDYEKTLDHAGLMVERTVRGTEVGSIGARLRSESGRVGVAVVTRGGAAQRAGIDAGDELIALNDRRVETISLDAILAGTKGGEKVSAVFSRDGRVRTTEVTLDAPRLDRVKIVPQKEPRPDQRDFLRAWLGE